MKILKRNSNIELLRIISMFMIVLSHYVVHGGIDRTTLPIGPNRMLLEYSILGNIGVIIFILITGYYSVNNEKPFKLKRLISLIFQVFFYSALFYLVFVFMGLERFSMGGFVKNFLPVTFNMYWFVTVYIILYIFIPYINILLNKISREKHLRLVIILLVLFSIIPTFIPKSYWGDNEIVQVFMYYIIGAYLGKYKDNYFSSKKHCYSIMIMAAVSIMLLVLVFDILGANFSQLSALARNSAHWLNRESIFSILFSIALFSAFANRRPFTNNFINSIASCVLGVYLISDNHFIRKILWVNMLDNPNYANSPILILHMAGSVVVVFAVCAAIEFIRQKTLEKMYSIIYNSAEKKIISLIELKK